MECHGVGVQDVHLVHRRIGAIVSAQKLLTIKGLKGT